MINCHNIFSFLGVPRNAFNCMRFPPLLRLSATSAGAPPVYSCTCIKTDP